MPKKTIRPSAPTPITEEMVQSELDVVTLTQDGLDELKEELRQLKEVKLPTVIERVATARSYGDLKENAEYHSAREEQQLVETRIEEIETMIARAKVVKQTKSKTVVGIGSQVTLHKKGDKKSSRSFHVVGESEADPTAGKISSVSPLGAALMGKKKDDEVTFTAPSGQMLYVISDVQ